MSLDAAIAYHAAQEISDTPENTERKIEQALANLVKGFGRPCDYTHETAARIIQAIEEGMTIKQICREDWAPSWSVVWRWMGKNQAFKEAFQRARAAQSHMMADEALETPDKALTSLMGDKSDNARVNAYRVKYEALKWRAGVYNPEYRDKQLHQHTGSVGVSLSISGLDAPNIIEGVKVEG